MSSSSKYRPKLYDISLESEYQSFTEFLENNPDVECHDTLASQIRELVKTRNPSFTSHNVEIDELMMDYYSMINYDRFGIWVYYSWCNRAVRILPENEFIEVRTSRNRMKITHDEQSYLKTKKIGVVGLSVGQSVAITLALERSAGELRLADYDILELSNLNRIRARTADLGLSKAVILAREIAELDPYLNVKVYEEGITDKNVDEFLEADGGIDLLHEECDDVYVKIMIREKARTLGIPVIMEASDKCTVDIERFDLDKNRPLLHGRIENINSAEIKDMSDPGKAMSLILDMVDIDKLSARVKASIVEVGHSISTWPQLASAVNLGGGVSADIARQILLNNFYHSGRFQVDLDEIFRIPNPGGSFDRNQPDAETIREVIAQYHKLNPESESFLKAEQLPFRDWVDETFNVAESNGHLFLFSRNRDIDLQEQYEVQILLGFICSLLSTNEEAECIPFPVSGSRRLFGVIKSSDENGEGHNNDQEFRDLLTNWSHSARPVTLPEELPVEGIRRNLLTTYGAMQVSPVLNPYLSYTPHSSIALRLIRQRGVLRHLDDWDSGKGLDPLIVGQMGSCKFHLGRLSTSSTSLIGLGRAIGQLYSDEDTENVVTAIYVNGEEVDKADTDTAIIHVAFGRIDKGMNKKKRSKVLSNEIA